MRVVGTVRNYQVDFQPGLNIISGEISTGKSTILKLIDYCLGAANHPQHVELQRRGRACLLDIQIGERRVVIERPLFSARSVATVHECTLDAIRDPHVVREVSPVQTPGRESISSYILKLLGLWGTELVEAPTQSASGTDKMSFRDVMSLCYLENKRLDNEALLFENDFMKALKLRQVFDVCFGIHENRLAQLSREVSGLGAQHASLDRELATLNSFLGQANFIGEGDLRAREQQLTREEVALTRDLEETARIQRAESEVAQGVRLKQQEVETSLRRLKAQQRQAESLLARLVPLRGQYAQEIKKVRFLQEAHRILDPYEIAVCPACGSDLKKMEQGSEDCALCGSHIKELPDHVDLVREVRALEARLREINDFIQETETGIRLREAEIEDQARKSQSLLKQIDEALANFVSPAQTKRDELVGQLGQLRQEAEELRTRLRLWEGVNDRRKRMDDVSRDLREKAALLENIRSNMPDRRLLVDEFSVTFGDMLRRFRFPKLSDPVIDEQLVPHVRGIVYRLLGSNGALTLTAMGWYAALLSLACERSAGHPGFLMIDSPQKNIGTHRSSGAIDEEYRDDTIVHGVYEVLVELAQCRGEPRQMIVVDNAPPGFVGQYVIVRYTGRVGHPPYGFIEDEEG